MSGYVNVWSYIADFFLEWKMFQTTVVEKNQNVHIMFNNGFWKIVPIMIRRGKILYSRADHNKAYAHWMLGT